MAHFYPNFSWAPPRGGGGGTPGYTLEAHTFDAHKMK